MLDAVRNSFPTKETIENTVLTRATSLTDSEVVIVNDDQFESEKLYYLSISIAKSMLEKDVIDEELFALIDSRLKEKYKPVSAILLTGKPLT